MYNLVENVSFVAISATPTSFVLRGGQYGMTATATWGGGSATLQRLAADNSTFVTCLAAFTADGYAQQYLPSGRYRILVATATNLTVDVTAVYTRQ